MRKLNGGLRVAGLAALGLCFGSAAHAQEAFTTWTNALKPGATVAIGGVSQEFTYTSTAAGVGTISPPSTNLAITFTETYDASGDLNSVVLKNANRSVGFYKVNGDSLSRIGNYLIYARSTDWTRQALTLDAASLGFTYQTFAVWQEGLGQPAGSMGAASVGAITAGTSVPQAGSASFSGVMGGIYNDAAGQDHVVIANMQLAVNFGAHSATFNTSSTIDRTGKAYSDLNISGTFVSLPNHPALFGTLNTSRLTGTSSAQFYGPGAQEVGGVFTLTPKSGTGLERLAGAFGGKRATAPPPSFVSWRTANERGYTATVSGKALEFSATGGVAGVTAVTSTEAADTTYSQTLAADGYFTGVTIAGRTRAINFNEANGDALVRISDELVAGVSADQTRIFVAAEPIALGWNYQTFGLWQTTDSATAGSGGVFSVGAATPAANMPTSGTATFRGLTGGVYIDTAGLDHAVTGDLTVAADFGARRATFSSTAMVDLFSDTAYTGTDLSGVLTYAAGQNQLTGTLTTANTRLSGTATGQFFGPLADEVGGIFALAPATGSTSVERLFGGFGAKR